jgi:hypothetical protein
MLKVFYSVKSDYMFEVLTAVLETSSGVDGVFGARGE